MHRRTVDRSILLLFPLLFASLFGFVDGEGGASHSEEVKAWYLGRLDSLAAGASDFYDNLETLLKRTEARPEGEPGELQEVREEFIRLKLIYKEVEPLVGRLDRHSYQMLNGPPLLRVDEHDLQRTVIRPEGFQSIAEHLFAGPVEVLESDEDLLWLAHRLRYRTAKLRENGARLSVDDRQIFEALRSGLVRIAWLGLTGFDSPVLANCLQEGERSMEGIRAIWRFYEPDVAARAGGVAGGITERLEEGIALLRTGSFDDFDRLAFLKNQIGPLYSDLLAAHYALGYPTWREVTDYTRPLRYEVADLFDPEAFDPFFFSPDPLDRLRSEQVELGEELFYDTRLSKTLNRSCASCHRPDMAFADGLVAGRTIAGEGVLGRNSPTLLNAVFQTKFFWDGRAEHLEHQIEDVLLNHAEMHMTFEELIERLRGESEYRRKFAAAFAGTGDTAVTKYAITRSLAGYIRTLVSLDSEFDRYLRGEVQTIDPAVRRGFNLFMGKASCGTCHFPPFFNGLVPPDYLETETEVLGVTTSVDFDHPVLDDDPGRYNRFGDSIYLRSFKTPTLRHIAGTAPYMHNGSLPTLRDVVEFYDRGGGAGLGLDVPNQTLPAERLELTEQEKEDLVRFMEALGEGELRIENAELRRGEGGN